MSTTEIKSEGAPAAGELDLEQSLDQLAEMQAKLYKLRVDLPNVLRGLAHIDERDSTSTIFGRTVNDVTAWNNDVEEFIRAYQACGPVLELGRKERTAMAEAVVDVKNEGSKVGLGSFVATGASQDDAIVLDDSMSFVNV